MWKRLASMYTNLNLSALIFYRWMPEWIRDIMRASTLLIFTVVASVWSTGDMKIVYLELFDSFAPNVDVSSRLKYRIVFVFDILLHVVPVFLVGLPTTPYSFIIAYCLLLTWFRTVRKRIHEIYSPTVPAERGMFFAGLVACCGAIITNM